MLLVKYEIIVGKRLDDNRAVTRLTAEIKRLPILYGVRYVAAIMCKRIREELCKPPCRLSRFPRCT